MTRKIQLRRQVRQAAAQAGKAAAKVGKRIKTEVRRGRVRTTLEEAGKAVAAASAAAIAAVAAEEGARALHRHAAIRAAHQSLGWRVDLPIPVETAIQRVTEALAAAGFGVLTRIDAHSTFQQKLKLSFRSYTILGACNPDLAFRALSARSETGLLLPCNVTVEDHLEGGSRVRIADPAVMLKVGGLARDATLREIAGEARQRLEAVVEELRRHAATPRL
jgi:uncharacterized protein (DUF302 family)